MTLKVTKETLFYLHWVRNTYWTVTKIAISITISILSALDSFFVSISIASSFAFVTTCLFFAADDESFFAVAMRWPTLSLLVLILLPRITNASTVCDDISKHMHAIVNTKIASTGRGFMVPVLLMLMSALCYCCCRIVVDCCLYCMSFTIYLFIFVLVRSLFHSWYTATTLNLYITKRTQDTATYRPKEVSGSSSARAYAWIHILFAHLCAPMQFLIFRIMHGAFIWALSFHSAFISAIKPLRIPRNRRIHWRRTTKWKNPLLHSLSLTISKI